MTERPKQPIGIGRRLRRFALIVIWAVPLAYLSGFIGMATSAGPEGFNEQEFGTAVVERCSPDGPLGMPFWHSCEVQVRWDDGDQSRELVPPPDLEPADIGTRVPVVYLDATNRSEVRVDEDRPWWWVWWLTGAPALGLACLLVLIGFMVLFHGTRLDITRMKRRPYRRLPS
ncbi:MAG: DUF6346 domain-containing protein [Pseudonocardiaceae bacterium]